VQKEVKGPAQRLEHEAREEAAITARQDKGGDSRYQSEDYDQGSRKKNSDTQRAVKGGHGGDYINFRFKIDDCMPMPR
jgi:hypothetical protein